MGKDTMHRQKKGHSPGTVLYPNSPGTVLYPKVQSKHKEPTLVQKCS